MVRDEVAEALIAALGSDIDEETQQAILFSFDEHGSKRGQLPATVRARVEGMLGHDNSEIRVLVTRILGFLQDDDIDEVLTG